MEIKENIKAPRHWPLCGEFTGDRNASNAEKVSIWLRHHDKIYFWLKNYICIRISSTSILPEVPMDNKSMLV